MDKLKVQQEKVVKPLIVETKIKEELCARYKKLHLANRKSLQTLTAILRLPVMTTRF